MANEILNTLFSVFHRLPGSSTKAAILRALTDEAEANVSQTMYRLSMQDDVLLRWSVMTQVAHEARVPVANMQNIEASAAGMLNWFMMIPARQELISLVLHAPSMDHEVAFKWGIHPNDIGSRDPYQLTIRGTKAGLTVLPNDTFVWNQFPEMGDDMQFVGPAVFKHRQHAHEAGQARKRYKERKGLTNFGPKEEHGSERTLGMAILELAEIGRGRPITEHAVRNMDTGEIFNLLSDDITSEIDRMLRSIGGAEDARRTYGRLELVSRTVTAWEPVK